MSSYNDFLKVVSNLPANTYFAVTYDWCVNYGLKLVPATAKRWGKNFVKDYANYDCTRLGVGTDSHNFYKKN